MKDYETVALLMEELYQAAFVVCHLAGHKRRFPKCVSRECQRRKRTYYASVGIVQRVKEREVLA